MRNHWIAAQPHPDGVVGRHLVQGRNTHDRLHHREHPGGPPQSLSRRPNTAIVTFSGGGAATLTRVYRWASARFRAVEFEYDSTPDANPVNSVADYDHPNHPAALRNEALTIDTVYRRAGFTVTNSGGDGGVPVSGTGANGTWSDAEMHDAMQIYWSRFSNAPRRSLWVFSAALHDIGSSLGGIMFDDIGPNHRQGTAIFTEAFISVPPPGDPAPDLLGAAHEVLDDRTRDGPRVQPRRLSAEVARGTSGIPWFR